MALRTDELQLRVLIDGTPARKELAELAAEEAKVNSELKGMKRNSEEARAAMAKLGEINAKQKVLREEIGLTSLSLRELQGELAKARAAFRAAPQRTEQWVQAKTRLDEVKDAVDRLTNSNKLNAEMWDQVRSQYKLADMNLHQLRLEADRLRAAMLNMNPNTAGFVKLRGELSAVEARMRTVESGLGPFGRAWAGVKGQIMGAVAVLGSFLAGGAIINLFRGWVRGSAELSDAQANVRKTTGLTQQEVEKLTRSLSQLNTRTARKELLDLATDAGKLGISGTENILKFVRAGDQIRVALGEDLGEDAIKSIGKLNDLFGVTQQKGGDLEQAMLSTGSAINTLGQKSTAQEQYLVDFTQRIAGVATNAGIGIESVLGFASTLDQLGQQSETSSTALGRFVIEAFKQTDKYAQIAGLSTQEFLALLKTNANEALLRTLEGLNGNNEGLQTMASLFDDLGQDGARAFAVLGTLARNTKLVREQQDLANQSFKEGTSVTQEFSVKNSTLGANLEIIGKKLHGAFVNSAVVNGIKSIVGNIAEWVQIPLSETLEKERIEVQKTYAQILTYNEGTEARTKLIRELQARYPGFLSNISAETASNQQLTLAVKELNQQLVNKIILQEKDEQIQRQLEDQAARQQRVLEQEDDVRERMIALTEKYGVAIRAEGSLLEQAAAAYNDVTEAQKSAAGGREEMFGGRAFSSIANFGHAIRELGISYNILNGEQALSNRLADERNALMQRLGIKDEPTATATPPAATPAESDVPPTSNAVDKARGRMEELRKQIFDWRQQLFLDGLTADGREIAQIDSKYSEIRAAILANENHTAEDLAALDAVYAQARADAIAEGGEKRLEAERKVQEKVAQERTGAEDRVWLVTQDAMDQEIIAQLQHLDEMTANLEVGSEAYIRITEFTEKSIAEIRKKYNDRDKADARALLRERIRTYDAMGEAAAGLYAFLSAAQGAAGQEAFQYSVFGRALALVQIALSSASGVAKAIDAGADIPWPGNLAAIASGVGAVLTGIAQALNIINAAPPTPPAPSGGSAGQPDLENVPLGAQGGVFQGPSHDQGGLGVYDNTTGRQVAEVEGGEAWMVLSRRFTERNADLIPMLLRASREGARIPRLLQPAPTLNFGGIARAQEVERMAIGGIGPYTYNKQRFLAHDEGPVIILAETNDLLRGLINRVQRVEAASKRRIEFSHREYGRAVTEYEALKKRNTISRG